eukprot:RCo014002
METLNDSGSGEAISTEAEPPSPASPPKRSADAYPAEPPLKMARTGQDCASSSNNCGATMNASDSTLKLETDLSYCRADLRHEQLKWGFFQRKASRMGLWAALFGAEAGRPFSSVVTAPTATAETVPALDTPQPMEPNTPTSSSLAGSQLRSAADSQQLEALQQEKQALAARVEFLQGESVQLQREKAELTVKLSKAELRQILGRDDLVLEHPLYKAGCAAYLAEKGLAVRLTQKVNSLSEEHSARQTELERSEARLKADEARRRGLLEKLVYEKDAELQRKEEELRDMRVKQKHASVLQAQLSEAHQKLRECGALVSGLRAELKASKQSRGRVGESELAQEIERISAAYEALAEQNSRLLHSAEEKDRQLAQLTTDKTRAQLVVAQLKAEREQLGVQAKELGEQLRVRQDQWIDKLQNLVDELRLEQSNV